MTAPVWRVALTFAARVALLLAIVCAASFPIVLGMVLHKVTQLDRQAFGDGRGERVLFLGNSLTFFGEMPGMVAALSRSPGSAKTLDPTMIVRGGALLQTLLDQRAVEDALEEPWAAVVLQPQSLEPTRRCSDRLPSLRFVRSWRSLLRETETVIRFLLPNFACSRELLAARLIRAARSLGARGVRPVVYWLVPHGPWHDDYRFAHPVEYSLGTLDSLEALSDIARAGGAALPGVTSAFLACEAKLGALDSSLRLLAPDHNHPTREGSYLVAWLLFDELTGGGGDPALSSWWAPDGMPSEHAQWIRACASRWHELPAIFSAGASTHDSAPPRHVAR